MKNPDRGSIPYCRKLTKFVRNEYAGVAAVRSLTCREVSGLKKKLAEAEEELGQVKRQLQQKQGK